MRLFPLVGFEHERRRRVDCPQRGAKIMTEDRDERFFRVLDVFVEFGNGLCQ